MGASTSIKTENKRACGGNTPWRTRDPIQPPCRHHARHLRSVPISDSKTSDLLSSHGESQLHTVEDGCRTNVDCFRILVAGLGILALYNGQEKSTLEEIVSLLLDRVCNNFWVDIDRHDLCDISMTWKLRRTVWTDVILL